MKKPNPQAQLLDFKSFLEGHIPFTFIRFSDGEIEVLRNRYLELGDGMTIFRGQVSKNRFKNYDFKKFDPLHHQEVRSDLISSALFRGDNFYKGIPTRHNNALIDREFLVRLNGGFDNNLTFSDLFMNSNYDLFKTKIIPLFSLYKEIFVIANYRTRLVGPLKNATLVEIGDNFFSSYNETLHSVMSILIKAPSGSLILSSASSLSNIVGYKLYQINSKLTFLDVGTTLNEFLSLDNKTREYHGHKNLFKNFLYKNSKRYTIKW